MTPPYSAAMRVLAPILLLVATAAASPPDVLAAGLSAYAAHDFVAARNDFRTLADDGSAIGETMLGTMYARGQGVRRDAAAAAAYYCRAAHRGYPPAQLAFAQALAHGDGVAVDRRAAAMWIRLAADRGDARVAAAARRTATTLAVAPASADDVANWRPWPTSDE